MISYTLCNFDIYFSGAKMILYTLLTQIIFQMQRSVADKGEEKRGKKEDLKRGDCSKSQRITDENLAET